jgi:hypothetical protein
MGFGQVTKKKRKQSCAVNLLPSFLHVHPPRVVYQLYVLFVGKNTLAIIVCYSLLQNVAAPLHTFESCRSNRESVL